MNYLYTINGEFKIIEKLDEESEKLEEPKLNNNPEFGLSHYFNLVKKNKKDIDSLKDEVLRIRELVFSLDKLTKKK